VSFAPNVIPGTYVEPELPSLDEPGLSLPLFPSSQLPAPAASKEACIFGQAPVSCISHGQPNAFMLFVQISFARNISRDPSRQIMCIFQRSSVCRRLFTNYFLRFNLNFLLCEQVTAGDRFRWRSIFGRSKPNTQK
jgi:hypothetical protein